MIGKLKHSSDIPFNRYVPILANMAWLLGLNGVQRFLGVVTTYFLVRALNQNDFGTYSLVLSVIAITSILTLPGLDNAVMQSVARGNRGTYRKAVFLAFFCSLMGSIVLSGLGFWYALKSLPVLSLSFFLAAFFFPFSYGITQWRSLQTGSEKFSFLAKLDSIAAISTSIGIIGIVIIYLLKGDR